MKRPALPLMLLILASIFLLFLLNLLLGSVHIPFGKIWELLWGTGAVSYTHLTLPTSDLV